VVGLLLASGGLALALWPRIELSAVPVEQVGAEVEAKAPAYPSREEIDKNWPRFRGPRGLGVAYFENVPTSWDGSTGEGILWKTAVPMYGHSSPIVWDDRVFLSGGDEEKQEVYCFDGMSGGLLWQKTVPLPPGGRAEEPDIMEDTGYAAATMACDHQRVYAIFATGDVAAFTFDGEPAWVKYLGVPESVYGYATSLAMYQDRLLIQYDQGDAEDDLSSLLALEGSTGRMVWRKKRPVANSWTSPVLIDTGKEEQFITCSDPLVVAYEPATGRELWRADIMGVDVAPSPVFGKGMVFVVQPNESLFALRADGSGDITETHLAWTAYDNIPDVCSPVCNDELIILLATFGIATCYSTETGEMLWEHDFEEDFQASPTLAGNRVYLLSQDGVMHIIEASETFKEIGRAELHEGATSSPAFLNGRIYIRGYEHLYCIEND
jgi:outer membrane protein assembly factor BamB